jgi:fumarate hydratase class II
MVCAQVMGHDVAIGMAASLGQFELNVYQPLIALNLLDSIRMLGDAMQSFRQHCVAGLAPNPAQLALNLQRARTLVTALTPQIGFDQATQIAHWAQEKNCSLLDAVLAMGFASAAQFDAWVDPRAMRALYEALVG